MRSEGNSGDKWWIGKLDLLKAGNCMPEGQRIIIVQIIKPEGLMISLSILSLAIVLFSRSGTLNALDI
jgi:hypothetical protein